MFIILEGVDCSGKTWVAAQLLKKIRTGSFLIKHGTKPLDNSTEEQQKLIASYQTLLLMYNLVVAPSHGYFIIDRYYPSELAYSLVKRRYEAFDIPFYDTLEAKIVALPHLLIYVETAPTIITKRMFNRGDDYVTLEEIPKIAERYRRFLETTKLNHLTFNNIPGETDKEFRFILETIERIKNEC